MDIAAKNSISDIGCVHESLGKSIEYNLLEHSQLRGREEKKINKRTTCHKCRVSPPLFGVFLSAFKSEDLSVEFEGHPYVSMKEH
jgi:hypothetical protein